MAKSARLLASGGVDIQLQYTSPRPLERLENMVRVYVGRSRGGLERGIRITR